jgi:UDPglucose 6-dehydrogenase
LNISIIGSGYVGLVSGVCLAEKGHCVTCVDSNPRRVAEINRGIAPFYESGLEELLRKNLGKNLSASSDLGRAVAESDVSLIAVGTPFNGMEIDLSQVKQAAAEIGKSLARKSPYHCVVVKSTVVPGTTDDVVLPILEKSSGKRAGPDFGVGMNPEFMREGCAIPDFMVPDRVVLGGSDDRVVNILVRMYEAFQCRDILRTNNKTAEMIKYASNSLFATFISFSNEIANLCSAIGGIDITDVMKGVHLDKRLSPSAPDGTRMMPSFTSYLEAGCGFGGSCFPKDVKALISHGEKLHQPMRLLESVISINERQPDQVLSLLKRHFRSLRDVRVAVLGLAFKPDTSDTRESPAIPVIKSLVMEGAKLQLFDPAAVPEVRGLFGSNDNIVYCDSLDEAIEDVHAVIVLTKWDEFRSVPEKLVDRAPQPVVIDGRRMFAKSDFAKYEGIGL